MGVTYSMGGDRKNAYVILVVEPDGLRHLGDLDAEGRII
jgi:hypothetical protein